MIFFKSITEDSTLIPSYNTQLKKNMEGMFKHNEDKVIKKKEEGLEQYKKITNQMGSMLSKNSNGKVKIKKKDKKLKIKKKG